MDFLSEYFIEIILTIISIFLIVFKYFKAVNKYEYNRKEYEKKKIEYENQFWLFKFFSTPPRLETKENPKEHFGLLLVFIFLSLVSIYFIT